MRESKRKGHTHSIPTCYLWFNVGLMKPMGRCTFLFIMSININRIRYSVPRIQIAAKWHSKHRTNWNSKVWNLNCTRRRTPKLSVLFHFCSSLRRALCTYVLLIWCHLSIWYWLVYFICHTYVRSFYLYAWCFSLELTIRVWSINWLKSKFA